MLWDFRYGISAWVLVTAGVVAGLCLLIPRIQAQNDLYVESISTEQGLSQGAVFDILQDRDGFLWIGTKDGLNRYDGYSFDVFTNDPNDPWSISGNTVVLLFEDSSGRIWANSENTGIDIYDKTTGRFHHIGSDARDFGSLSGSYVDNIVEDTSGYFVVGIEGRELNVFRLEEDFFEGSRAPQIERLSLPVRKGPGSDLHPILNGLVRDAKDRIWVGGHEAIYQLDLPRRTFRLAAEGVSIGQAFANPDGSVWSCGVDYTGIYYWDGVQAVPFSRSLEFTQGILVDDRQRMWCQGADSLYVIDLAGWKPGMQVERNSERIEFRWQPKTSAREFPLKSITQDRSGTIWVGTNGSGLFQINPDRARFAFCLPGISVRRIVPVSDSEMYIREYGARWVNRDGELIKSRPLGDREGDFINDFLLISSVGEYWIRQPSVNEGISRIKRYHPTTGVTKFYPLSLHHNNAQPMIESRDGAIWMAGLDDILTRIDPESEQIVYYDLKTGDVVASAIDSARPYSQEYSTALYEDIDGVLWIGTERGFAKCIRPADPTGKLALTVFRNIPGDDASLSYNHVMCFLDDPLAPRRYLWVCTKGGGLNRMDKRTGTFLRLAREDGLPDDVVYGILPDRKGNLWGGTNKGLFCMSRVGEHVDEPDYVFRNFSRADGLQDNEFNTDAYATLPDGRLMFGGINGANIFDPDEVLNEDYHPNVRITGISINNTPVRPGDETGVLTNTIETTASITLNHLQDILTLEFASLDFRAPDQIKYRYQLVGEDDAWIESGNRRSATFLHLDPGGYTFRVQGTNSRGIWSEHIAELQIRILPPWWRSWWAYAIYIMLIITAIWTYLQFSINRSRLRQQLEFEHREAERVKELDAMKTQLFMNMTHEFRTPLSIILGMAQQVSSDPKQNFRSGMDMIIRNGQNLLNLVNKMLNLSKLESGKLTLDMVQGDIVIFLRNLVESFRSFAANKEIQLHFLPEVDVVVMDYDPDKLQQVISNLISNAFKFTPEGGHIYFSVRREDEALVIRVKDTGLGIPAKDQDKIFDRFYQVDNSMTREYEGTGIGLALTSQLINLMKGEIRVESPPVGSKQGSEFIIRLPMHHEALIAIEQIGRSREEMKVIGGVTSEIPKSEPANAAIVDVPVDKNQPLILLVEDNADVVAYVASCLTGYQLAVAENGKEGLEMAIDIVPDLIISDVMMPVMDGFQLCRKLKSDNRTDHIPLVMLTARADRESKIEGLEFGANVYLAKPFEKQELLLTLRNLFALRSNLRRHHRAIVGLSDPQEGIHDLSGEEAEDAFVIKVRDIVSAHLDDIHFNVETLAKMLHLSHSQLGRKLDALTGLSPNRFIRAIRLQKAKELLLQSDTSVASVAYDCGFNDPNYFSRVFKKETGRTPLEWIQESQVS